MLLRSGFSVVKNSEKRPVKKRKKNKKASLSSLPDDLVLSCLARFSRLYYPTLSLVSKKFRSLIASPELYKVRSLLGLTESCLYVFLRLHRDSDQLSMFTLSRRVKSENILVPIPSPQGTWSNLVAVGSNIYSIGGKVNSKPSSNVSVLDCRSHTWHQAPNMETARRCLAAHFIDGKIYVLGGRLNYYNSSWIEAFDSETRIWNVVSISGREVCGYDPIYRSIEIDGKICMYSGGHKGVAYNPRDGTCDPVEWEMCREWVFYSHCVVQNVLFHQKYGKEFEWFDKKARLWRKLKGLERMPKILKYNSSSVKLADYGGKIAVFWETHVPCSGCDEKKEIWSAVIAIERRDNEKEIWGKFEWFDVVLTVPMSCSFVRVHV